MDQGQKRLAQIFKDQPPDSLKWNEAQNRFQFIDRLLTECLGWEKPNIRVQEQDDAGGRVGYLLGQPPKAVLEAKRQAQDFGNLPGSATKVRKLSPLLSASRPLREAVVQAVQYCALKGAKTAIVCNGPQLAIFQAISPDMPPLEGECFFFNGFQSYFDDFTLLWTLLSPEGVAENRAYREISLHRSPRIPPKASESISNPDRYRYRSDFQEEMRQISLFLLEEIEESSEIKEDFYKNCYVNVEANNRHTLLSKQIILHRYQRVTGEAAAPVPLQKGLKRIDNSAEFEDTTLARGSASRPIVVLGDVGVGKTSFFENLYFGLREVNNEDTYFIHVNLGSQGSLTQDLRMYIINDLTRVLRQKYDIDIH